MAAAATLNVAPELLKRIKWLAEEYEQIRAKQASGDERTRRMEVVASRMRSLAADVYPCLDPLTQSQSPGERLAAIILLQVIPNAEYTDWLVARFTPRWERPFVQYHAGVALLTAAQTLADSHLTALRRAVNTAQGHLGDHPAWDRHAVLEEAAAVLDRRLRR